MTPTLGGFIVFLRTIVGIQTDVLPDDAPVIAMAFEIALEIVNVSIAQASAFIYQQCVYNLGASEVLQFAVDNLALAPPKNAFFANLRTLYNINAFTPGVVAAAADVSTSVSLEVIEAAKNFTIDNLQRLKDPYGRQYLGWAQDYGPAVWGLTA